MVDAEDAYISGMEEQASSTRYSNLAMFKTLPVKLPVRTVETDILFHLFNRDPQERRTHESFDTYLHHQVIYADWERGPKECHHMHSEKVSLFESSIQAGYKFKSDEIDEEGC